MKKGFAISPGTGGQAAVDEIGGLTHQVVKVGIGPEGEAEFLAFGQDDMDHSIPTVMPSNDPIRDQLGAKVTAVTALGAGGSGIIGWLSQIWDKLNGTLAVSASALPLPAGAATAANQATEIAGLVSIDAKLAGTLTTAQAAGENHVGAMGGHTPIVDVVLTLDTSAYQSGDVLADTQTVANVLRVVDGTGILQSIHILDEDDQGQALDLVFFSTATSLGTVNAGPSIADAGGRNILGIVSVGSGEFIDLGGCRSATKLNVGLPIKAISGTRSLGVAAISRGTGTYSINGIRLRLGALLD